MLICIVVVSLCYQLVWIAINHPYQYVYFNSIGKQVAEKNFALDYWGVSHLDLLRCALSNDDSNPIKIDGGRWGWKNELMMNDDERSRILWTNLSVADYHLQDSRGHHDERIAPRGYAEMYAITVDGMSISTIYKRVQPEASFDDNAWKHVILFESSSDDDFSTLVDGDLSMYFTLENSPETEAYMLFGFDRPVDYDQLWILFDSYQNVYRENIFLSISLNGSVWTDIPLSSRYKFEYKPYSYRFLKIAIKPSDDLKRLNVHEIRLGYSY